MPERPPVGFEPRVDRTRSRGSVIPSTAAPCPTPRSTAAWWPRSPLRAGAGGRRPAAAGGPGSCRRPTSAAHSSSITGPPTSVDEGASALRAIRALSTRDQLQRHRGLLPLPAGRPRAGRGHESGVPQGGLACDLRALDAALVRPVLVGHPPRARSPPSRTLARRLRARRRLLGRLLPSEVAEAVGAAGALRVQSPLENPTSRRSPRQGARKIAGGSRTAP